MSEAIEIKLVGKSAVITYPDGGQIKIEPDKGFTRVRCISGGALNIITQAANEAYIKPTTL